MKKILLIILFASVPALADCDKGYAKIGAGYKFQETYKATIDGNVRDLSNSSKISARFEIGVECDKFNFGVAHHSQWLDGAPFNDRMEHSKTEVFIDYRFDFNL